MATFVYRSQPAIDQDGNLASVGTGQVFAINDDTFTTPLTVTKPGGVSGTDISVSQLSLTETFSLEDRAEVWWKSGSLIVHLASISGMLAAVESSAQAAQIAALAAQSAPSQLPLGGDTGQVLGKLSVTDRDVGWIDGGTGGGGTGADGKSAYEIAFELDSNIGTESEWLASLQGQDGADGNTDIMVVTQVGGAWPAQPATAPLGIKARIFMGPTQYGGPTWAGVRDAYIYTAV